MSALYKDQYCNVKNGYISYFYPNGNLEARGRMIDNKREGNYMSWHFNGMIEDSAFYHNDRFIGYKLSWHSNGMIADSSFRRNDSTTVYVSWFDNGSPSAYGVFLNGKKQGQWNYFHKSGNKAAIEINERGKVSMVDYFNEDGTTLQDNSYANRDAVFKEGLNDWNEYLIDHVFLPGTYKFTNTNQVTIEVSFTINEDGDTEDAIVLTPFQYRVDQEVLDAIKASPKWHPAIEHNRKVKMKIKQPHTFVR
ncbi:MAG: energy transducer TonB [Chitinophagaceae bacterium]|nr:energy transducer TonB [Chitinophagaceae bacterium]